MKHYRLYHLSNDRITRGETIIAENDHEIISRAENNPSCPVCEIWEGTRKVKRIELQSS